MDDQLSIDSILSELNSYIADPVSNTLSTNSSGIVTQKDIILKPGI
jgi:hypothetical protein